VYNQIAQLINTRASTHLEVVPATYPAPNINMFFARIVGMMQGLLLIVTISQKDMLPEGMRNNKMAACLGIFLVSSMLSSAMTKSDAFEIYKGDKLIFSKIQAERMPNLKDLTRGFKKVGVMLSVGQN
jgi:hypothetical protein